MKDYRAIIFDFDMTLADTAVVIVTLLNQVAGEFGYPAMAVQEALSVVGYSHEIMLSHVTGEKDPGRLRIMRDRYRQVCRDEMPERMEYFPDVPASLRRLKEKGMLLGVLSQKSHDALTGSLEKHNLARFIDLVMGCEDVPAPKPDPGGLLASVRIMGLREDQVLFVGDHLVDQETARAAGVDFAAMLRGSIAREEFDQSFVKEFYRTAQEVARRFCGSA